jgi:hypothetical protein
MEEKMKSFVRVTLTLIFLLITSYGYAQLSYNKLRTGSYGYSLLIAVNTKEKNVTGKFGSSGGYLASEGWDCNFYFSGEIQPDGSAKIVAVSIGLNDDTVRTSSRGILYSSNQNDAVIMKLFDEVSGCVRGEDFMEEEPEPRQLIELNSSLEPQEIKDRRDGVEYRIVSSKRSYFYETASSKSHKKAYLIYGDVVLITAKEKITKRVKAIYTRRNKTTSGWLLEKDLLGIGKVLN